jgi:hypothetical protein
MLLVLAIAILVGLARGGKLSNLTSIDVRAWWLLFLGFALQIGGSFIPVRLHELAVGLILSSYLPLLVFVWLNRQMAGLWVAGIGILMNFTVIALNGGMPVMLAAAELAGGSTDLALGAKHVVLDESTRLAFLADVIPLPANVISIGDVFLVIGVGVFLEDHIRRPLRLFAHRVQGEPGSAADR